MSAHDATNEEVIRAWSNAPGRAYFGDEGDFARKYLLNPAIFSFLSEVRGRRILDAGCGNGYLSRMLARRGADVTGVEPAAGLYKQAVERERDEPLGITYRQEDLCSVRGLDGRFDAVVANMVFMDIPDYVGALRTCIRALIPGGSLVFSLVHPCFEEPAREWPRKGYVEVQEYLREHTRPQDVGYLFHRPLSAYLNLLVEEGCIIRRILEPGLEEELVDGEPLRERAVHVPQYLVVHAVLSEIRSPGADNAPSGAVL